MLGVCFPVCSQENATRVPSGEKLGKRSYPRLPVRGTAPTGLSSVFSEFAIHNVNPIPVATSAAKALSTNLRLRWYGPEYGRPEATFSRAAFISPPDTYRSPGSAATLRL